MRQKFLLAFLYAYLCVHLTMDDVCGQEEEENGDEEEGDEENGDEEEEDPAGEQFEIDADNMEDLAKEIAEKAVEKQLEVMQEQQQKAQEFVDTKLDINIEPEKGWKTEDMFVPPGFHVDAEMTGEDEKPEGEAGDQPFLYPMGVGGMLMNSCTGTNYQPGDPCYEAYWETTICASMIDGAAFIGVGFDGRGDYSPESRKMSIVQRDCSGRSTYDDFDVPDTMNVHGVYDTSAAMQTFYSREEYQQSLQQQAGMAGSAFGFYGGVKKAWGSSTLSGSQKYMALFEIDIDRYEIYLDEVKPGDLSVNFLREFMDLPLSYLAPGAAMKFQNFILRWGTHYIKSGKFGGRLQVFKTMEGSQVSSKAEFSQVMEAEFRSLFASFHTKQESKQSSSQKRQRKTSSTSISVEGGDQEIASIISDLESPTIKTELKQWLESIRTFPKPFKFMVAPITNLLKFNAHSLFPDEETSDWGCEANKRRLKKDPNTDEFYYEVEINGTLVRKPCPYLNREALMYDIDRRRANLDIAIGVYMEEGPISLSDISIPAGEPGCQTENYNFQKKSAWPTWEEMTNDNVPFVVFFVTREDLVGKWNGPSKIPAKMEKVVQFFNGKWFVGDDADHMDMTSSCKAQEGEKGKNKVCIMGITLAYSSDSGFLRLAQEDLEVAKMDYNSLRQADVGRLFAHVEWPQSHVFRYEDTVGYLPCNLKWSNALRFDPSNTEGKCLHFTAVSEGTIFVVFAAVPNDRETWYYVEISPYGVGIFKSQKLEVSTTDASAVGLGSDVLYQSYFVCVTETSERTAIEYGKSSRSTGHGEVFLTMVDVVDPLYVRWYSFGNGEDPLQVVDAHILSRQFTKATCRGENGLDETTNMCTLGFECRSYKVIDQVDRGMSFSDLTDVKCDDMSSIAWYRMMGRAGDQIPEKCVPINRCGTRAPGWLNGKHPNVEEGVVTRQVCYNWNDNCCNWKNDIKIRNCGDFFVYQLQKPPTCSLRYCGNADECSSYQVLDQADRSMSFADKNVVKCDQSEEDGIPFTGWYRFMGDAGDQMPDKCVASWRCGAKATGWLNGAHPTEQDGVVTREVCYNWDSNCCRWKNSIKIRNCGEFYVYELQKPPTCNLRYCGNRQGKECEAYKKVDEADRAMGFANQSTVKCDGESGDNLNGWYRMTGKAGDEMPEKCVPIKRCGTLVTGWLNGKHPTEEEGVVTREVCYNWNDNCCNWKNNIQVRNCGDFYVYDLIPPPDCNFRYCGNKDIEFGSECQSGSHKVLAEADRAMGNTDRSSVKCDRDDLDYGWYRIAGDAGDQIPEKCVPEYHCGTHASGWLNGKHPTVQEGIVTRQVCYRWDGNCCKYKNDIRIRNCGGYYVYELQKPPNCDYRYCGNNNGCQKDEALGMQSGKIINEQITGSSQYAATNAVFRARLNIGTGAGDMQGGWSAAKNDANQWLQVDFVDITTVKRVATQGRVEQVNQWVTKYKLQYRDSGSFQTYFKTFTGNSDRNTVVTNKLDPPFKARYVRLLPVAWHGYISMRIEFYGCKDCAEYVLGSNCKVVTQYCSFPTEERENCGYSGISKETCQARGCCWDSQTYGVYWCFFGKLKDS